MLFPKKSQCNKKAKVITCEENKMVYRAFNPMQNKVGKYQIDGDIIPLSSPETRCDYLVENETDKSAYFIELKGCDLSHAIEQVEATLIKYKNMLNEKKYTYFLRIVCHNATHSVNNSLLRRFKERHKGKKKVIVKGNIIEETIS